MAQEFMTGYLFQFTSAAEAGSRPWNGPWQHWLVQKLVQSTDKHYHTAAARRQSGHYANSTSRAWPAGD
jgi:hypothetical protein